MDDWFCIYPCRAFTVMTLDIKYILIPVKPQPSISISIPIKQHYCVNCIQSPLSQNWREIVWVSSFNFSFMEHCAFILFPVSNASIGKQSREWSAFGRVSKDRVSQYVTICHNNNGAQLLICWEKAKSNNSVIMWPPAVKPSEVATLSTNRLPLSSLSGSKRGDPLTCYVSLRAASGRLAGRQRMSKTERQANVEERKWGELWSRSVKCSSSAASSRRCRSDRRRKDLKPWKRRGGGGAAARWVLVIHLLKCQCNRVRRFTPVTLLTVTDAVKIPKCIRVRSAHGNTEMEPNMTLHDNIDSTQQQQLSLLVLASTKRHFKERHFWVITGWFIHFIQIIHQIMEQIWTLLKKFFQHCKINKLLCLVVVFFGGGNYSLLSQINFRTLKIAKTGAPIGGNLSHASYY